MHPMATDAARCGPTTASAPPARRTGQAIAVPGAAAAFVFLALALACGRSHDEPSAPAPSEPAAAGAEAESREPEIPESVHLTSAAVAEAGIQTWKVAPVDLEHLLVLTGTVEPDEDRLLQLASNVRGRVVSIPGDLGKRVGKGDPVLWIESVEMAHAWDELAKLQADLGVSGRAYERAKTLLEAKAISPAEVQSREASWISRKVEAETAERTLRLYGAPDEEIARVRRAAASGEDVGRVPNRLAIRAPFDGRVVERKVSPGALVEALQPLATVADLTRVRVFLQAYEKDLALLQTGLPVTVRAEAYPQETFRGKVDFLASLVDDATRTVRVRAMIPNPAEKLRPGMFVRAQVEVPQHREQARATLAVPQSALQTLEGRTHVFVQSQPGVFVRRVVETGHTFEGFTEILSGVKTGDVVVTEGSFVLKGEFARAMLVEED